MAHSRTARVKPHVKYRNNRLANAAVVAGIFAAAGFLLLRLTSAATYTAAAEVESAMVAGAASASTSAGASAGAAITFGVAVPDTPFNLNSYTGGDGIALRWDVNTSSYPRFSSIKQYDVYRNGTFLKSVTPTTPSVSNDFFEYFGMGTVDMTAIKGTAYIYQVRTVSKTGVQSPLSQAISVTNPTNSFATPNITVDTSQAPDLADFVNNSMVPYMRVWYPKIAHQVAVPKYNPPNAFKIILRTTTPSGVAVTTFTTSRDSSGATSLTINPVRLRENMDNRNFPLFINLVIRTRQTAVTYPEWVVAGVGVWAATEMQRVYGMALAPNAGQRYDDQFGGTPQFFEWVRLKYSTDILRNINHAVVTNTYTDSLWTQYTGKTLAQLQAEWQPTPPKGPALVKFSAYANKCLDNNADGGKTDNRAQIWDCNGTGPQLWGAYHQPDGSFTLKSVNNCLAINSITVSDSVVMGSCRGSTGNIWKQNPDGSIVSQYLHAGLFGKCLETPDGNQTIGTQLRLATCDGSAKQKFSSIPK